MLQRVVGGRVNNGGCLVCSLHHGPRVSFGARAASFSINLAGIHDLFCVCAPATTWPITLALTLISLLLSLLLSLDSHSLGRVLPKSRQLRAANGRLAGVPGLPDADGMARQTLRKAGALQYLDGSKIATRASPVTRLPARQPYS